MTTENHYDHERGQDFDGAARRPDLRENLEIFDEIDREAAQKERAIKTAHDLYRAYFASAKEQPQMFKHELFDALTEVVRKIEVTDIGALENIVKKHCQDGSCGELEGELLDILRTAEQEQQIAS